MEIINAFMTFFNQRALRKDAPVFARDVLRNASGELRPSLYEGIYGGPPPSPAFLRAYIKQARLSIPFNIAAIQHVSNPPPRFARLKRFHLMEVHPGITYLCFNGSFEPFRKRLLKRSDIIFGEPVECRFAAKLIRGVQNSIHQLRARELEAITKKFSTAISFSQEIEARNAVIQAVRSGDPGWLVPFRAWGDILLTRNNKVLNTVRRKILELILMLTREIDHREGLNFPFRASVDRLFRTFALTELVRVCEQILRDFMPILSVTKTDPLRLPTQKRAEPVERALAFMRANYSQAISLVDVADATHTSAPYLSRLFRAQTGHTLTDYLHALRIQRAKELLTQSDTGTLQIALSCGFNAPEHFFRTFRKLTGVTPKAYRRAQSI